MKLLTILFSVFLLTLMIMSVETKQSIAIDGPNDIILELKDIENETYAGMMEYTDNPFDEEELKKTTLAGAPADKEGFIG